jgi:hypothetical protein
LLFWLNWLSGSGTGQERSGTTQTATFGADAGEPSSAAPAANRWYNRPAKILIKL